MAVALDSIGASAARERTAAAGGELARLARSGAWDALVHWLTTRSATAFPSRADLVGALSYDIALVDELLSGQVDAILHHPRFQALEAAWRGLRSLVDQIEEEDDERIKIRVLDVAWKELVRDAERAIEFDQSQLFKKVYSDEFGAPGGEPFGVLLGDYEIRPKRSREHPEDDVGALRGIAQVAAAAFAPFIAAAHPSLFDLDSFRDLERPIALSQTLRRPEFMAWNTLRRIDDSRFVGLCLPRILMRKPYRDDPTRTDLFVYREDTSARNGSGLLFGSAAWAFGSVLIRAFAENGWLAQIRGVERDQDAGGLVERLEREAFATELPGLVPKGAVEVRLSAEHERELLELGFLALSHCHGTALAAFLSSPSIHVAPLPSGARGATIAEVNERLSSMLQYIFCVSRFAHYVKVIARDKIGSYTRPEEIESLLSKWLVDYATSNENASAEILAKYPLREARVEVREVPGRPGIMTTVVHLRPHYQIDQMTTAVKLVTELFAGRAV